MVDVLQQFADDFYGQLPGGEPVNLPPVNTGDNPIETGPIQPTFDIANLREQINKKSYNDQLSLIDRGLQKAKNEGLFTFGSLLTTAINPAAGALSFVLKGLIDDSVESKEDRMAIEAGLKLNRLAREQTGQNLSSTDIISSLSDLGFRFRTQEVSNFFDSTLQNQATIDASRVNDQSELIKQRNAVRLEAFLHNSKHALRLPGNRTEWYEYGTIKSPGMNQLMEIAQNTFGNIDYKVTQKPNGTWALVVDDEEDYQKLADVFKQFVAIGGDEALARQALNADDSAYLAKLELQQRYRPLGGAAIKPIEVPDDAQLQVQAMNVLGLNKKQLERALQSDPGLLEGVLRTQQDAEKFFPAVAQMPDLPEYSGVITQGMKNIVTNAVRNVVQRRSVVKPAGGKGIFLQASKEIEKAGKKILPGSIEERLLQSKTPDDVDRISFEVYNKLGESKFKELYASLFDAFYVLRKIQNDPRVLNRLTTKERAATQIIK